MPQNSKWRRNTRTVPQNGNAKWYIQETRKEVQYMEMKNWTSGVMECFYKIKPFDEEEEHIGDTERECLENVASIGSNQKASRSWISGRTL